VLNLSFLGFSNYYFENTGKEIHITLACLPNTMAYRYALTLGVDLCRRGINYISILKSSALKDLIGNTSHNSLNCQRCQINRNIRFCAEGQLGLKRVSKVLSTILYHWIQDELNSGFVQTEQTTPQTHIMLTQNSEEPPLQTVSVPDSDFDGERHILDSAKKQSKFRNLKDKIGLPDEKRKNKRERKDNLDSENENYESEHSSKKGHKRAATASYLKKTPQMQTQQSNQFTSTTATGTGSLHTHLQTTSNLHTTTNQMQMHSQQITPAHHSRKKPSF
jgi:hypothetical protein